MTAPKFALLVLAMAALLFAPRSQAGVSRVSCLSGGKKIAVDRYSPVGTPTSHAILVLHGAGGTLLDGPEMRRKADSLAAAGNTVYLVHYFNRTGSLVAVDSTMQQHFEVWLQTVRDAVTWAGTDSKTGSVGIYGYSLGAFLAVAAASNNPRVGAVVEQAGGVWNSQYQRIGRMPPVLTVHGREDRRVPFAKYAEPLARLLRGRHALAGTLYLPNEGHVFTAPANAQVSAKAAPFFAQHLGTAGH